MADGGLHLDPVAVGIGSSLGTALLAWLGQRLVGKAAIQTAVSQTYASQTAIFKELLDQLRIELKEAAAELHTARTLNMRYEAEIRQKDAIIQGFERTTLAPLGRPAAPPDPDPA
jgi:hypothetical protein